MLALDFVFYGISTFTTEQARKRRVEVDYLIGAVKTTETFEGNAGRIVGQVETLLALAVSSRIDIQPTQTVVPSVQELGVASQHAVTDDSEGGNRLPLDLDPDTGTL